MSPPPVELRLIPTPGAKAEFLAAVQPLHGDNVPPIWQRTASSSSSSGKKVIVLEGYTRDAWSLDTATKWTSLQVTSVDGRNKLPGFVNYLRERQKTAYGRFALDDDGSSYMLVISHKQASSSTLACRVALLSTIPNCPWKPPPASAAAAVSGNSPRDPPPSGAGVVAQREPPARGQSSSSSKAAAAAATGRPKKRGIGLLGNLVAGQLRTNQQVVAATSTATGRGGTHPPSAPPATGPPGTTVSGPSAPPAATATASDDAGRDDESQLKTSAQVLADFRHEMEQKMLDFDIAPDTVLKIQIQISDHARKVIEADKSKVTLEVLKYIVYEQAEEVNEEWITYKEPSEFLDEVTVAIYKDADDAPPEVLEDINKAEITDEMRAQQAALQEHRRQQELRAARQQAELQNTALRDRLGGGGGDADDDDFAVLNSQKRDRRTIEDYQRGAKRQKGE
jgi:hypothetical protein